LFYCAAQATARGETRYGTASIGDVWLLLEYPFWWGARPFEQSALPAEVKAHLRRALETIPRARLLLIKQDKPRRAHLKLFVARTREREPFVAELSFAAYEELTRLDLAAVVARPRAAGATLREQLYLICTNGRRDKCCAKYGYPLYKHLRAAGAADVWQCTHVGGDRFAANLVCFPDGLFYAHVTEQDAPALIAAYGERRIVLDKFRGRACFAHPVQAAEYFIRAESGLTALSDLRLRARARVAEQTWRISFAAPATGRVYETLVSSRPSVTHYRLTCTATNEHSIELFHLEDYRITSDRTRAQA
jgi:hypothetical protein